MMAILCRIRSCRPCQQQGHRHSSGDQPIQDHGAAAARPRVGLHGSFRERSGEFEDGLRGGCRSGLKAQGITQLNFFVAIRRLFE